MPDPSGYEMMRAGELYASPSTDLVAMQSEAARRLDAYNRLPAHDGEPRNAALRDLLGSIGRSVVRSPVTWEYGKHIHLGDWVFINFDCIFLDGADITIGDGTVVAPRAQFLTAGHPLDPMQRALFDADTGEQEGWSAVNRPIVVGKHCWIGAGAMILGGVTIGDGVTIGAGSVVTKDIPAGVLAAGSPCRVIRTITQTTHTAATSA